MGTNSGSVKPQDWADALWMTLQRLGKVDPLGSAEYRRAFGDRAADRFVLDDAPLPVAKCANPGCNKQIVTYTSGKPRKWCSERCRVTAHRAAKRAAGG